MTPSQRLAKIAHIYERRYKRKGLNVTTPLYYNLLGAVIDLKEHKKVDKVVLGTLDDTLKRIAKIGKLLDLPSGRRRAAARRI